jgi:hypothetical protein
MQRRSKLALYARGTPAHKVTDTAFYAIVIKACYPIYV